MTAGRQAGGSRAVVSAGKCIAGAAALIVVPCLWAAAGASAAKEAYWYALGIGRQTLANPGFLGLLGVLCALEYRFPARPESRRPRWSIGEDFLWLPLRDVAQTLLVLPFAVLTGEIYQRYLGFLTVESVAAMPLAVRAVWGVLLQDLVAWYHHWARHRISWCWEFHKVHHSQVDLNAFTDHRYHPVEYFVSEILSFVPLLALSLDVPQIAALSVASTWYRRFCHANIRCDLGPLRYVLVTPQSHRIHHSLEPRHRDVNFGVLFSIWDRLFGTHCEARGEYPSTGIDDPEYGGAAFQPGAGLMVAPARHLMLPVMATLRRLAGLRGREGRR